MAIKRRGKKQPAQSNYRKWRATLKSQGLFGKRVNLSKRVTPKQKGVIKKYMDVATGKAKAITLDKKRAGKIRRLYGLKGPKDIVIVPKAKGERITSSKKTGEIKVKKGSRTRVFETELKPGKAIPGSRLFYSIYFQRGNDEESYSFEDMAQLKAFMQTYEKSQPSPHKRKGWKNWRQYIIREYLDNEEIKSRREEGGTIKTSRKKRTTKSKARSHK